MEYMKAKNKTKLYPTIKNLIGNGDSKDEQSLFNNP